MASQITDFYYDAGCDEGSKRWTEQSRFICGGSEDEIASVGSVLDKMRTGTRQGCPTTEWKLYTITDRTTTLLDNHTLQIVAGGRLRSHVSHRDCDKKGGLRRQRVLGFFLLKWTKKSPNTWASTRSGRSVPDILTTTAPRVQDLRGGSL